MYAPNNMANHFQPVDVTVNGMAKTFFKENLEIGMQMRLQNNLMRGVKSIQLKLRFK